MKAKRIICAIVCLMMAFALLPPAASAKVRPGIWVGGTKVGPGEYYLNDGSGGIRTDASAGNANYNVHYYIDGAGNEVLVLKDASITKNYAVDALNLTAAVYTEHALTVCLIGSNTLSGANCPAGGVTQSYGIFGAAALTIEGSGRMIANGGKVESAGNGQSCGVYGDSVAIAGGRVRATGSNATVCYGINGNSVTIQSGTVDAIGGTAPGGPGLCFGVYGSNSVTIENGTVTAVGGDITFAGSYGVFSSSILQKGGTLTATGGDTASGNSIGMRGGFITIEDGTLTAAGGDVTNGRSYGVHGEIVAIEDGAITATGGKTGGANCSSNGVYGTNSVSITGGTVNATGGAAMDEARGYSNGIYSGSVSITGGTVDAVGGESTNGGSFGVYGTDSLAITRGTVDAIGGKVSGSTSGMSCGLYGVGVTIEDSTVTTKGGTIITGFSYGVYGGNFVTASDTTLTAVGGQASRWSCGVSGYNGIAIDGGTVTATGGESGSGSSYGLFAPRTDVTATISISAGTVEAAGVTVGVKAGQIRVTGGTLTAYGDTALACTVDSLSDCLTVGPAGQGKGLLCRVSDASRERDWSAIAPYDAVYGTNVVNLSASSDYFLEHSVRISEESAVSGTVTDADGNPVDHYSLYLDGASATYFGGSGTYTIYVENGTHVLSAESGTQIGAIRVTVNGAPLSDQDIRLGHATTPGISVTPGAAFTQGGAPDGLTLIVGNPGGAPNRASHFGSLEISRNNAAFTTVDSANYSLHYGSIHIRLSRSWLNSLTPGTYTLRVNLAGPFAGISLTTQLFVSDVPETGDGSTPLLWFGLMLLCGAALSISARGKRQLPKRN